ncbi:MAG: hypothetical protein M3Z08_10725 [Chloroflexota bacterium]|nr:hypothetical protein [Chloroflexota bacterium]
MHIFTWIALLTFLSKLASSGLCNALPPPYPRGIPTGPGEPTLQLLASPLTLSA